MNPTGNQISDRLKEKGLKITPQRIAVLDAVYRLKNHPSAERIIEYIRNEHPGIASGTVYKVLDVLIENELVIKVKTERDIMRYDGIIEKHHHLYCADTDKIEDFADSNLDELLSDYFRKNDIAGFEIEDISLQIKGKFRTR